MAESIEMPFELRTRVVPMNHVLDGVLQIPIGCGKFLGGGAAHCKIRRIYGLPSVRGGDATFCQVTLTTQRALTCRLCLASNVRWMEQSATVTESSVDCRGGHGRRAVCTPVRQRNSG